METHCVYIKNTSFSFQHQLYNDKGDIVAEATDIIVTYDFNEMLFPPTIKSKFEAIETKITLIVKMHTFEANIDIIGINPFVFVPANFINHSLQTGRTKVSYL